MTFAEYWDKWFANIAPDRQAAWNKTTGIAFCAQQMVRNDIEEEYNAIKSVGHYCPIMDVERI